MSSSMGSSSAWNNKSVPVESSSWRPVQQVPDRYDRSYNDRSSGYPSGGGGGSGGSGMYGSSGSAHGAGRAQDRYGAHVSSRY